MPGLSFSELGFTSESELNSWLDKPFSFDEINTVNGLVLSHYEYAVREGDFFCLRASGFNNVDDLYWYSHDENCARVRPSPHGNVEYFIDGVSVGDTYVSVLDRSTIDVIACAVEVISFSLEKSRFDVSVGEAFEISVAETSYRNSDIALRTNDTEIEINGTTVTARSAGTAYLIAYLVERPTVTCRITVNITSDEPDPGPEPDPDPDPAFQIIPDEITVYVGETINLSTTGSYSPESVIWSPTNLDLFDLDAQTGRLTAKKPGCTIVVATIDGTNIQDGAPIFICGFYSLSATNITLLKGQTYKLTYSANLPSDARVYYGTNNPEIASMGYDGTITGVKAGSTSVGVWVAGHNSTLKYCYVTVEEPDITFLDTSGITEGDSGVLKATVSKPNCQLIWESSNSNILRIDNSSTGAYTALSSGDVTVTATIAGSTVSASTTIHVESSLVTEYIQFSQDRVTVHVGDIYTPQIKECWPDHLTPYLTYEPDDGSVSVDGMNVTMLAECIVTLTVHYGRATDTMTIEILPSETQDPLAVSWNSDANQRTIYMNPYLESEREYSRTASVYRISDGKRIPTNIKPIYSSSNQNVAVVDQSGNVQAVGAGTAIITAKTPNNTDSISYTVEVETSGATGAALYRVPFDETSGTGGFGEVDLGPRSQYLADLSDELRQYTASHGDCTYPIYVQNGKDDNFEGIGKAAFCGAMATSKLFYFETHGMNDHIYISSGDSIYTNDLIEYFSLDNGSSDALSGCNLAMIIACRAGGGSFCSTISQAGAKIVIGLKDDVNGEQLNDFLVNYLIPELISGKTIGTITKYATNRFNYVSINCDSTYNSWTIDNILGLS